MLPGGPMIPCALALALAGRMNCVCVCVVGGGIGFRATSGEDELAGSEGTRGAGSEGTRGPGAPTPTKSPRTPGRKIVDSMAEYGASAEVFPPPSWGCQSPTSNTAHATRHTPPTGGGGFGGGAQWSPFAASPPFNRASPASAERPPILDRHSLERYLHSAAPLARRLSADGFGASGTPTFGASTFGAVNSPPVGMGGDSGGIGLFGSPLHSPTAACWATRPTSTGWTQQPAGTWSGLSPEAKYQKAMYVPMLGDRLDRAVLHAQRAAALLRELRVSDTLLERWRDNLRLWISAAVLKPLMALARENEAAIKHTAAHPQPAAAVPTQAGFGGGLGGGLFSAVPKPAGALGGFGGGGLFGVPQPAAVSGATVACVPMSPEQWVASNQAHPLVHQLRKLERFWRLPSAASDGSQNAASVKQRVKELAHGHCVACYRWNSGGTSGGARNLNLGGALWDGTLPTDAEVIMHVFRTFFDCVLVPPPPGVDGRPPKAAAAQPAAALGLGGGLFGPRPVAGGLGGGLFGGLGGWGAPAQPATSLSVPAVEERKNENFWVGAEEMVSFSARHFCPPGQPASEQARSSVVVVQQRALPGESVGSTRGQGVHYDLLAMHVPWAVRAGDNNAWDVLVLLAFYCEKTGGTLGRTRLGEELHTAFRSALVPEPAVGLDLEDASRYRSFLSILHPWSEQLEVVQVDSVNAALKTNA